MDSLIEKVRINRRTFTPELARAIRQAARLTQEDIGDDLDVHRVTVARWELGLRRPRGELRERYLDLLDALRDEVSK